MNPSTILNKIFIEHFGNVEDEWGIKDALERAIAETRKQTIDEIKSYFYNEWKENGTLTFEDFETQLETLKTQTPKEDERNG